MSTTTLLLLVFNLTARLAGAFLPLRQHQRCGFRGDAADTYACQKLWAATVPPSSASEMNEWILSLSLEPTDAIRREKLAAMFADKYNDEPFCDLFDQELIVLGDAVKKSAAERQAATPPTQDKDTEDSTTTTSDSTSSSSSSTEGSSFMDDAKSPEARQLWAIVDLMIQKKTLVKRARDEAATKPQ